MRPRLIARCLHLLATIAIARFIQIDAAGADIRRGELLYSLDMNSPAVRARAGRLPAGVATWDDPAAGVASSLRITVPEERTRKDNIVAIPVDLKPWRGARVLLTCKARADHVSTPIIDYNGIKCQLHWISRDKGPRWYNENRAYGSFDWKELSIVATIDDDADLGWLNLGMQSSHGTVWLADVRITALQGKARRPALSTTQQTSAATTLRGVMSPTKFDARDFVDLKELGANLVRWQLVNRNWGKAGEDQDPVAYDHWLDGKLDELEQALDAARNNGIKVVIDMHSPPGGRLADSTLRMVFEKKHQDHFIAVWERIVRRFKGHPAIWAYDIINEPVQNRPSPPGVADCIEVQMLAARAIRKIDPSTILLLTADQWSSPDAFAYLQPVPADISNVVYQVHMYWPGQFSHQGVNNTWGVKGGDSPLAYPGSLGGLPLDKEALRRHLAPVREFQLAYGVRIYVGEFGAVRWAPGAACYLDDLISLFEEYGWDWSYHAFREWPGWSFEHADLPYSKTDHPRATQPTDRALVLKKWFSLNHP
ncbi:MAG: glycoside hydrolase family 5 protein [Opitutaceae bacterium]|jgi:hypothetical protein|nr:glycoside hydrolase family 5 protein [Opitutaceae bacterium]